MTYDNNHLKEIKEKNTRKLIEIFGGKKSQLMTGCKYYANYDNEEVTIKYTGSNHSNILVLKYNVGLDLIDMTFKKLWNNKFTTIEEIKDLYADQIREIFTDKTKLILTMPRILGIND